MFLLTGMWFAWLCGMGTHAVMNQKHYDKVTVYKIHIQENGQYLYTEKALTAKD